MKNKCVFVGKRMKHFTVKTGHLCISSFYCNIIQKKPVTIKTTEIYTPKENMMHLT